MNIDSHNDSSIQFLIPCRAYASSVSSTDNPWVGYYNSQSHGVTYPGIWLDSDGVACPYASWATGEPNNNGGDESCAVMLINGSSYTMQDVACSLTRQAVLCTYRPNGNTIAMSCLLLVAVV